MKYSSKRREFIQLIRKYLQQKASQQEILFLEKYYHYFEKEPGILDQLSEPEKETLKNELFLGIQQKTARTGSIVPFYKNNWFRAVAAGLILVLSFGSYYFNKNKVSVSAINVEKSLHKTDALPGGNKAMLLLADGSSIILDTAKNGVLARQSNTNVLKLDNGQLAYRASGTKNSEIVYNTITTPRGGQYHLVLPDKSTVFLNAASSIRFPVEFSGNERSVEITGEAYFEVAKDPGKTFKVLIKNKANDRYSEVEVLGTHFNINAYFEESYQKTTLVEGSIRFSMDNDQVTILPGEQVQLSQDGNISIRKNLNMEKEIAWVNSLFIFDHNDIQSIMCQISNWYDVDVAFQGQVSPKTFSGIVSRKCNVSEVLKIMETAGIKFEIEGKKITVSQ